jgi:hypothetical protein
MTKTQNDGTPLADVPTACPLQGTGQASQCAFLNKPDSSSTFIVISSRHKMSKIINILIIKIGDLNYLSYQFNIYYIFYSAPGPPGRVELFSISRSQLHLTWRAPEKPNGIITAYNVTWRRISNDKKQNVDGNLNQTRLSNDQTSYIIGYLGK